jgi:hypothetical protein
MNKEAITYELAVLIGRAQGTGLLSPKEALFAAGCLALLAEAADVPTNSIREAIHPIDLNDAKAEANR